MPYKFLYNEDSYFSLFRRDTHSLLYRKDNPMKNRILAVLLAAMLTSPMLFSCAGGTETETTADTTSTTTNTNTTETEEDWQYPDKDFEGGEYRVLNLESLWDMYIHMDAEELTGETLNDAVYNRNRKIEDKLNCVIYEKKITESTLTLLSDETKKTVTAGTDEYETVQVSVNQDISVVTGGYLMDLKPIDGLNLDETWWDQDVIQATTLNGKLFFTTGSANLMAFDSLWCLFFNESMMADYNLEKPYDLVREGKWTLDALTEYCAAVANLNGDEKFTWNKDGNAVWGLSAHVNCPEKFYYSCGVRGAEVQKDGSILYTLEDEHFYNVTDKLAILLNGQTGMTLNASTDDFNADAGGYVYVFSTRRALFMNGEIKAAQLLRDMEDTFGILPFPKYDENQENYQSTMVHQLLYQAIPTTNTHLDLTATVMEVMAHDSHVSVIPVYYDSVVEHKGLRNEDSVEMLDILRENRGVDIAVVFAWTDSLRDKLRGALYKGDNQVASILASQESVIQSNIEKFVEYLNE